MAIQIIPNLEAQKGAIEHQNRLQGIGQALQGYGQMQEKKHANQKMAEAYRKMGLPEELMYAPEKLQQLAFERQFPEAAKPLTELDRAKIEAANALTTQRKAKTEQIGKQEKLFNQIFNIPSAEEPTQETMSGIPMPKSKFGQGILKEGSEIKPKELLPKDKKPFDLSDARTWTDDQVQTAAAFAGQPGDYGIYGNKAEAEKQRREKLAEKKEKLEETKRKETREDIKEQRKEERKDREYFDNQSKDFDKTISEEAKSAKERQRALDKQIPMIKKIGKWDRFISNALGGTRYENWFKSATAQEFDSYSLPQLKGWKSVLGGVLSDSDIRLIMQKVVTSSKEPGANEKIAEFFQLENNIAMDKEKIASEIKRDNKGYRPANYEQLIDQEVERKYGDEIRSRMDEIRSMPEDMNEWAKIGRIKVPSGTPITDEMATKYLQAAKGNVEKASKWAREDGYDFPDD